VVVWVMVNLIVCIMYVVFKLICYEVVFELIYYEVVFELIYYEVVFELICYVCSLQIDML